MIVKNEEKNIEKALSWAKGLAFEQIVVDTGSTDRTVEIAERMGAKIYHFEWINDFSAAKNYAIEQASGNWIAFLDADEYFSAEDAQKMMKAVDLCQHDKKYEHLVILNCPWVHLTDEGKVFLVGDQNRIFRNRPDMRYTGAIHEYIDVLHEHSLRVTDISIMHTGYTESAYAETGKAERNIELIKAELAKKPDDAILNAYLADSLYAKGTDASMAEAYLLYKKVVDSGQGLPLILKCTAYLRTISLLRIENNKPEEERYVLQAIKEMPENPDFYMLYGEFLFEAERYTEAWENFLKCENILKSSDFVRNANIISLPALLFNKLCLTAVQLEDAPNAVKYATLVLKEEKFAGEALFPLIMALKRFGNTPEDEIFSFLDKLYDFSKTKDKLFVARAANSGGCFELAQKLLGMITEDERNWLEASDAQANGEVASA